MQVSLQFADSTVKQVENDLYFLSFRAIMNFLSSLGFFESVFWQRTVLQGIPHEAGNVGLYTTSPILWLQL